MKKKIIIETARRYVISLVNLMVTLRGLTVIREKVTLPISDGHTPFTRRLQTDICYIICFLVMMSIAIKLSSYDIFFGSSLSFGGAHQLCSALLV